MCRPVYFNIHSFQWLSLSFTMRKRPRQSAKLLYYMKAHSTHIIKQFCRLSKDVSIPLISTKRAPMCRPVYFNIHSFSMVIVELYDTETSLDTLQNYFII